MPPAMYIMIGDTMGKAIGYVLIKCEKDAVEKVYKVVVKQKNVEDVYAINGEYDILAKVTAKSPTEIPRVILQIRKIPGVAATKTHTVVSLEA